MDNQEVGRKSTSENHQPPPVYEHVKPEEYRNLRKQIGSQTKIAKQLGVNRITIIRRETGQTKITPEAIIAITTLNIQHREYLYNTERQRGLGSQTPSEAGRAGNGRGSHH